MPGRIWAKSSGSRLQQNTSVLNGMYYRSIIMAVEALASWINIGSSGHKQSYVAFLMRKPRLAHRTSFSMHSNDMICVYVHATWRLYKLLLRSTYLAVNAFTQRNNAPIKVWSVDKVLIKIRSFNAYVFRMYLWDGYQGFVLSCWQNEPDKPMVVYRGPVEVFTLCWGHTWIRLGSVGNQGCISSTSNSKPFEIVML